MIDIQVEVFDLLKTISSVNVYTDLPPTIFEDNNNTTILFYELDNIPQTFADNEEFTSEIYYNIDIYSKNPDTYLTRIEVDRILTAYGFVRLSGGKETRNSDFYRRLLAYKIAK